MESKNEKQETLSSLLFRDDILLACICDNAKEMIQGKFYQKLTDDTCHWK